MCDILAVVDMKCHGVGDYMAPWWLCEEEGDDVTRVGDVVSAGVGIFVARIDRPAESGMIP